jgi:hypothetical protein
MANVESQNNGKNEPKNRPTRNELQIYFKIANHE